MRDNLGIENIENRPWQEKVKDARQQKTINLCLWRADLGGGTSKTRMEQVRGDALEVIRDDSHK
jgi:hypothetical protein